MKKGMRIHLTEHGRLRSERELAALVNGRMVDQFGGALRAPSDSLQAINQKARRIVREMTRGRR